MGEQGLKIAIIGAGISGLSAAYYLGLRHQLTLYETAAAIGGHTATVDVEIGGRGYAIDTGFIVYNDWTYPRFIELLDELGVASKPTEMSFSVRCDDSGIEYGGNNLNTLYAQRRNLLKPSFHGMLADILRFNRQLVRELESGKLSPATTLGEYLQRNRYGEEFVYRYLVPMGCAIWSASTSKMLEFPLLFFARFFRNHGLLSVNDRPQWRVIEGGSRTYLEPLTRRFADSIRLDSRIAAVRRRAGGVELVTSDGGVAEFDQVVFACHSDQALALLAAVLTYNMNILQGIESATTFCVTLNANEAIDPARVVDTFNYSHPVFSLESIDAVQRIEDFNGTNRTWFAGAWLGNGFHEDGVSAGRRVAEAIDRLSADASPDAAPEEAAYA